MASINPTTLAILGLVLLAGGFLMPAETSETYYQGGDVWTETNEVEIKTPTMVVGVGFILAGLITRDSKSETENTDNPPD